MQFQTFTFPAIVLPLGLGIYTCWKMFQVPNWYMFIYFFLFLISICLYIFAKNNILEIFFILICHCHIRFLYRIKSIVINILGHEGKSHEMEIGLWRLYIVDKDVRKND